MRETKDGVRTLRQIPILKSWPLPMNANRSGLKLTSCPFYPSGWNNNMAKAGTSTKREVNEYHLQQVKVLHFQRLLRKKEKPRWFDLGQKKKRKSLMWLFKNKLITFSPPDTRERARRCLSLEFKECVQPGVTVCCVSVWGWPPPFPPCYCFSWESWTN